MHICGTGDSAKPKKNISPSQSTQQNIFCSVLYSDATVFYISAVMNAHLMMQKIFSGAGEALYDRISENGFLYHGSRPT